MAFLHDNLNINPIKLPVETDANGIRFYTSPAGLKYPSVTTALGCMDSVWLASWKAKVGEKEAARVGAYAANRGKIVHFQLERYLQNQEIEWMRLMPDVRCLLKSILPALTNINSIVLQETQLYSDTLRLAGTADLICYWQNKLKVVDFKTSVEYKRDMPGYLAQVAGYAKMFTERYGYEILETEVIVGIESGKPAQVVCGNVEKDLSYLIEARDVWETKGCIHRQ